MMLLILILLRGFGKKRPKAPAQAFLVSSQIPNLKFPIAKSVVTIGRATGCDIRITEKAKLSGMNTLSQWHARLEKRGERWVLVDGGKPNLPSASGIFVNGMRTRENYLHDGNEIRFGQVGFTFYTKLPPANLAKGRAR
jgi:pSer/pThr/pTyr-binding forkhead associated (FHA) protein